MAPAYQNINTGQVVVSDEPRPDLEALARWEEVPVPDETVPPAGAPLSEAELAEAAAREAAAETTANPAPSGGDSPKDDSADDETDDGESNGEEVPVPDDTWTHEQLDALAEKREIKFPANTNKAAKVAALTAPAGE
jgi:hypothetical protein